MVSTMATEKEVLRINGHEVTVTNPRKVYFPETGHTKLDLVRYYQAVAPGALRGAGGRPMALKRFVDGAAGQPFFQKRAPENLPEFIRTATLTFPSGRTADEVVIDDAAGLAWVANLGCIDLNPHPVRAEDLDHPDELRVDLDPVPGIAWPQIREVALAARESLEAVGLVGWPKTSGSRGIHINVRIEPRWTFPEVRRAALALARDVERRVPHAATSKWWKEERHGVFLDYNQNAKDRTVASAYSVRPLPDARVSTPLAWDEVPTVEAEAFTIDTVPARFAAIGDPGDGIDAAVGSLEALLELSARDEAEGLGDAPWPPNYAKQAGEPPRVQPSRARRPKSEYEPGRGEAGGPPPEVAAERAAAVAAGDPNAGLPTEWVGSKPTPTGRRKTSIPVVEISRAEFKEEALAGLETWKARHPEVVPVPRARGHPGRRDARPIRRLVSRPGQPHPRPGGGPAEPGAARVRLRPVGRPGHRGVEGSHRRITGAQADPEAEGEDRDEGRSEGRAGARRPGVTNLDTGAGKDWIAWHAAYDEDTPLHHRLSTSSGGSRRMSDRPTAGRSSTAEARSPRGATSSILGSREVHESPGRARPRWLCFAAAGVRSARHRVVPSMRGPGRARAHPGDLVLVAVSSASATRTSADVAPCRCRAPRRDGHLDATPAPARPDHRHPRLVRRRRFEPVTFDAPMAFEWSVGVHRFVGTPSRSTRATACSRS